MRLTGGLSTLCRRRARAAAAEWSAFLRGSVFTEDRVCSTPLGLPAKRARLDADRVCVCCRQSGDRALLHRASMLCVLCEHTRVLLVLWCGEKCVRMQVKEPRMDITMMVSAHASTCSSYMCCGARMVSI